MAKLTKKNVAEVLRKMNAFYQPTAGKCVATPKQMQLLVNRLKKYTKEVKDSRGLYQTFTDEARWALDMAAWEQRLDHYDREIDKVAPSERDTKAGCIAIYRTVTAPLLDGIYYEDLPGINFNSAELERMVAGEGHPSVDVPTWFEGEKGDYRDHPPGHSNPKPPDVVTPFSLGNQLIEYREHQSERLRLFWKDLHKAAKDLVKGAKNILKGGEENAWWIGLGLLGAAALVGGGYFWYSRRKRKKPRKKADDLERLPRRRPPAHRPPLPRKSTS